jgi:single-strand DNA-binding protein
MNSVHLLGRITQDLNLQYTQNNVAYLNFTVACDRRFKNQNGERQADFISCKAFKQSAEFIAKYFGKGKKIAIVGTIQTGKYDKNGTTVYTTDVIVDQAEFVEKMEQPAQAPAPAAPEPPKTDTSKMLERIQEQKTFEEELEKLDDLDLPFQF